MALFLIENWRLPACQEITLAAQFTETADVDGSFSVEIIIKTQQSSLGAYFDRGQRKGSLPDLSLALPILDLELLLGL